MRLVATVFLLTGQVLAGNVASNRRLAVLCSAVLPGSGQMILGTRVRGELMLGSELVLWSVWGTASWTAAARDKDARLIAAARAGANSDVTDPRYYRALELYDNSDEFNENVRREARARYPDDPDAQRSYYLANGYFGDAAWDWSPDSVRVRDYWPKRKASRTAAMTAGFAVGGLLLNRLVSALDCALFIQPGDGERRLGVTPVVQPAGIGLCFRF